MTNCLIHLTKVKSIAIISFLLLLGANAFGQHDTLSKYVLSGDYGYESITLFSDSTYHFYFSGCTEGGVDTGNYTSISKNIIELNSYKNIGFVKGDFSFTGVDMINDSTQSGFDFKFLNNTDYTITKIKLVQNKTVRIITDSITPSEKVIINFEAFPSFGVTNIYFPELSRSFSVELKKESNFLLCVLRENVVSQKKQIPLRNERLSFNENMLCGNKEKGFIIDCLPKLK